MKRIIKHINAVNPTPRYFKVETKVENHDIKKEEVKAVETPVLKEQEEATVVVEEAPVAEVKKPRKKVQKATEEHIENKEELNIE